jgi:hypothetical protein
MESMGFIVGGSAAMVALAAGILAHVDPVTSIWRAVIAFVMGWIGAGIWQAVLTGKQQAEPSEESIAAPPVEAETS